MHYYRISIIVLLALSVGCSRKIGDQMALSLDDDSSYVHIRNVEMVYEEETVVIDVEFINLSGSPKLILREGGSISFELLKCFQDSCRYVYSPGDFAVVANHVPLEAGARYESKFSLPLHVLENTGPDTFLTLRFKIAQYVNSLAQHGQLVPEHQRSTRLTVKDDM